MVLSYTIYMETQEIVEAAKAVLKLNDRGDFTTPAEGLYPHQWLWDSCFIAIGMSHYDVKRAQTEILSLLRGQWANGMIPHMIFSSGDEHRLDREVWRSYVSRFSPDKVATSGITQPPMVAEAVVQVGKRLSKQERRSWYGRVYPALVAYHEWLYNERDPHQEGLVVQIHSWETGLDNTPPWMDELHQHLMPFWIRAVQKLKLDNFFSLFRRDKRYSLPGERMSTAEHLALYSVQRRLRRKTYDINRILTHSLFNIEDLGFNAIFIRANKHLQHIANTIGKDLPPDLLKRMKKTEDAFEQLWDAYTGQYYSRIFITHKLLKTSTIATLLPLYAGSISKDRAKQLVELLHSSKLYGPKYPVPTVAINSDWFSEKRYWQGPTWINTNWLIAEGLKRYGYKEEAELITKKSLELVEKSGFNEYFSPLSGEPAGAKNFSWTAALTIDFAKQK